MKALVVLVTIFSASGQPTEIITTPPQPAPAATCNSLGWTIINGLNKPWHSSDLASSSISAHEFDFFCIGEEDPKPALPGTKL